VDLWLATSGEDEINQNLLTELNLEWAYTHKTLNEASQLTIDLFYKIFKNAADPCLETLQSGWKP